MEVQVVAAPLDPVLQLVSEHLDKQEVKCYFQRSGMLLTRVSPQDGLNAGRVEGVVLLPPDGQTVPIVDLTRPPLLLKIPLKQREGPADRSEVSWQSCYVTFILASTL